MPEPASLIIASKTDQASLNIAKNLIEHHQFRRTSDSGTWEVYQKNSVKILLGEKECIDVKPEEVPGRADRIIFVSKHRSNQDLPALTVHSTGNLGTEAKYGGRPGEVSWVNPGLLKAALGSMKRGVEKAGVEIEVTMEATHHGPTGFTVPSCFVEVGSTAKEYSDLILGRIAADAVIASFSTSTRWIPSVGFGGTHYPAKHTKANLTDEKYAVGHVVPKHAFEAGIDETVLKSTFEKTVGGCRTALVDWKGLKGIHRTWLVERLSAWEIEVVRC